MNGPTAILITGNVYAYGDTRDAAWSNFRAQISGADRRMQAAMMGRARAEPLTADEASEVAEMIATPWGAA